jgi:hypothetical protein
VRYVSEQHDSGCSLTPARSGEIREAADACERAADKRKHRSWSEEPSD